MDRDFSLIEFVLSVMIGLFIVFALFSGLFVDEHVAVKALENSGFINVDGWYGSGSKI